MLPRPTVIVMTSAPDLKRRCRIRRMAYLIRVAGIIRDRPAGAHRLAAQVSGAVLPGATLSAAHVRD
jgi:hypothetical protein